MPTEVRGLIDVPTFKVPDVVPPPLSPRRPFRWRATLFIYLRHIQLQPRDRKTDCAPVLLTSLARARARDRNSRRYLHANSSQARFRTRKNPHRDESGLRVLVLSHLRPGVSTGALSRPPLCRSLLPPTWRSLDASQYRVPVELLTLNPLLHIAVAAL